MVQRPCYLLRGRWDTLRGGGGRASVVVEVDSSFENSAENTYILTYIATCLLTDKGGSRSVHTSTPSRRPLVHAFPIPTPQVTLLSPTPAPWLVP